MFWKIKTDVKAEMKYNMYTGVYKMLQQVSTTSQSSTDTALKSIKANTASSSTTHWLLHSAEEIIHAQTQSVALPYFH